MARPWTPAVRHPRWVDLDGDFVASTEDYARRVIDHYDWRAHWHRRLYRLAGVVSIAVGAALPLLTVLTFPHKNVVISAAGCTVAAVTGLRGFYRWDSAWRSLRGVERAISGGYLAWQKTKAGLTSPIDLVDGAAALLERIEAIRADETREYFDNLAEPPTASARGRG